MSFHMHLRATPAGEVPDDFASLTDFMLASWEAHPAEVAAGIADSIEKHFGFMDQLYTGASGRDENAGTPDMLPIYGGRLVHDVAGEQPPVVVLGPAQVSEAAGFLQSVSFDSLWRAAAVTQPAGPFHGWDEAKPDFLGHHESLRGFYGRAALAEHAVVKAFWH